MSSPHAPSTRFWLDVLLLASLISGVCPNGASAADPVYPLKVASTGRYLVDQNNVPFLLNGNWADPLPVKLAPADVEYFFTTRKANGFNSVVVTILCDEANSSWATYDGVPPFTTAFDISTPNEAFFARLDDYINRAASHGLMVSVNPTFWDRVFQKVAANGKTKAYNFGAYLGNRYKNFPHIIWMHGNDFINTSANDEVMAAIINGIRAFDTSHIHTGELFLPPATPNNTFDDPVFVPLLDINGVYSQTYDVKNVLRGYNQTSKPVALVETTFEDSTWGGDFVTPEIMRRQTYWAMLAGAAVGGNFGNYYAYEFKSGWKDHLNTPCVTQRAYWQSFFTSYPWYNLVPDQTHVVVTAGYGSLPGGDVPGSRCDYLTAARTPDGMLVLAYAPTIRTFTVDMTKLSGRATARWFDPTNATYTAVSGSPFANAGTLDFTPPGNNSAGNGDWVLVLEASGGAAPPPSRRSL